MQIEQPRHWPRYPLLARRIRAGLLRLAGDLLLMGGVAGAYPLRAWGEMQNAVAVVHFLALTVYGLVTSRTPVAS